MQAALLSRIQSALPTHTNAILPIISNVAASTHFRSLPSSFFLSNHELSIPLRTPPLSPQSIIDLTRSSRTHSPLDILSCLHQIRASEGNGYTASCSNSSPSRDHMLHISTYSPTSTYPNIVIASSSDSSPQPSPPPDPNSQTSLSDSAWLSHFYLTIAHLHHTLPTFFSHPPTFPPSIYNPSISLTLPPPLFPGGIHLPSARAYGLFFGAARASLGMLLSDPWVRVERVVVLPPKEGGLDEEGREVDSSAPEGPEPRKSKGTHEGKKEGGSGAIARGRLDRKVRVMVKVGGRLRVSAATSLLGGGEGPDKEWSISNLYTFSPIDARITYHLVETVHPNPTEVARWLGGFSMLGIAGASSCGGGGRNASHNDQEDDHHPGWANFSGIGHLGKSEREGLRRLAEGGSA